MFLETFSDAAWFVQPFFFAFFLCSAIVIATRGTKEKKVIAMCVICTILALFAAVIGKLTYDEVVALGARFRDYRAGIWFIITLCEVIMAPKAFIAMRRKLPEQ